VFVLLGTPACLLHLLRIGVPTYVVIYEIGVCLLRIKLKKPQKGAYCIRAHIFQEGI
jgi:hypothetical protein